MYGGARPRNGGTTGPHSRPEVPELNVEPRTSLEQGARRILLTGATGYVGGRLLQALEARGGRLRCMARQPGYLRARVGPRTEVVGGDVLEATSLADALRDVDAAYYLVHSMSGSDDFEASDRLAARNFADAARLAGTRRIVYLGGLGHGSELSGHLRSRQEVGEILRRSGVPTIELRASIVVGSGSLSFEMVRTLVDKLPVMTTPRWVATPAQPIAIEDVIDYLVQALDVPLPESAVYEIGGADVVSYGDLMREYARQRGLKRWILPVPVLTPGLSSLWLGLVTPLYARVGKALIEGVRNPTIVRDKRALEVFDVRPRSMPAAIARALVHEDGEFATTRWSDALSMSRARRSWGGVRFGSRLVDSREARVAAPAHDVFRCIERIGGRTGWYGGSALWRLRGWLDLLAGGPGMRRGRRDPERLLPGDTVDCWRVEAMEPGLVRLAAEMRLPGRAWLQFEVEDDDGGGARLRQTALFDPLGLAGLLYWYALYPIHQVVFAGMLRGIARAATAASSGARRSPPPLGAGSRTAGATGPRGGES